MSKRDGVGELTAEDLKMLFSMLVKVSDDVRIMAERFFAYGWDEHKEEREYFKRRLESLGEK
jgi:hypothetical protein